MILKKVSLVGRELEEMVAAQGHEKGVGECLTPWSDSYPNQVHILEEEFVSFLYTF